MLYTRVHFFESCFGHRVPFIVSEGGLGAKRNRTLEPTNSYGHEAFCVHCVCLNSSSQRAQRLDCLIVTALLLGIAVS
jgi:hypothetical protein